MNAKLIAALIATLSPPRRMPNRNMDATASTSARMIAPVPPRRVRPSPVTDATACT